MKEMQEWWTGLDKDHQLVVLASGGLAFLVVVIFQPAVAIFAILAFILLRMMKP